MLDLFPVNIFKCKFGKHFSHGKARKTFKIYFQQDLECYWHTLSLSSLNLSSIIRLWVRGKISINTKIILTQLKCFCPVYVITPSFWTRRESYEDGTWLVMRWKMQYDSSSISHMFYKATKSLKSTCAQCAWFSLEPRRGDYIPSGFWGQNWVAF